VRILDRIVRCRDETLYQKSTKAEAGYGVGGDVCGACVNWDEAGEDEASETSDCRLVEGRVMEFAWCRLFARKRLAETP
jgi:hypothetical protein